MTTADRPGRSERVRITRLRAPADLGRDLARDVRAGLVSPPRSLPARYKYEGRGSELFEAITRQPEYYLTRTELAILATQAHRVLGPAAPAELVELGPGLTLKARPLLAAMHEAGNGRRYAGLDVSETALRRTTAELAAELEWLRIDGYVGDFTSDLGAVPRSGRRVVAMLGSTIGGFEPAARHRLLGAIRGALAGGDALVLGVDLIKGVADLEAAYNDAAGASAAFNRNVLMVIEQVLGASVELDAFRHGARFNAAESRIEMRVEATRATTIRLPTLGLDIALEPGDAVGTGISYKFTQPAVRGALEAAGLRLAGWATDPAGAFAVVRAEPA